MIKSHLQAAGETLLFMRSGIDRFDGSARAAWLSMLIPLMLTISAFWLVMEIPPLGAEDAPPLRLATATVVTRLVSLAVFVALIYGLTRFQNRPEGFSRLITASNWTALFFTLLSLPATFLKLADTINRQTYEDLMIWVQIYGYAVMGFIIWCCVRLPWELSAALAIFVLFINQTSRDIMFSLFEIPIVDYFDVY